jgi:hypothetical protein
MRQENNQENVNKTKELIVETAERARPPSTSTRTAVEKVESF